jgi:hypothetical protein
MSETEQHKTYTKAEVEAALKVVGEVTLDRVEKALIDLTYGVVQPKNKDDKSITVKQVIDWDDAVKAIDNLRGQSDEESDDE